MPAPETLRTFVAVPLSEEVTGSLAELQRQLKRTTPERAVSWVKPANVHVTLSFLGDILMERVDPIKRALAAVARHVPPFTFRTGGLGAFPSTSRPRVIWVGVQDPNARLALLYQAATDAVASVGFERESRPFSPHLTLGRVRRNASRQEVQALADTLAKMQVGPLGTVKVGELILFRSDLKPGGAEYTPLGTFSLGGPSPRDDGST